MGAQKKIAMRHHKKCHGPSALPARGLIGGLLFIALSSVALAAGVQVKPSMPTKRKLQGDCVGCHINVTPGIVKQHLGSPHANASNPEDEVLCSNCHGDKARHHGGLTGSHRHAESADTCGSATRNRRVNIRTASTSLAG